MRVCVHGAEGVGGGGGGYSKTNQYSRIAALITRSFNKCHLLLVCTETPGTMKMIGLELIGYGIFLVGGRGMLLASVLPTFFQALDTKTT